MASAIIDMIRHRTNADIATRQTLALRRNDVQMGFSCVHPVDQ